MSSDTYTDERRSDVHPVVFSHPTDEAPMTRGAAEAEAIPRPGTSPFLAPKADAAR